MAGWPALCLALLRSLWRSFRLGKGTGVEMGKRLVLSKFAESSRQQLFAKQRFWPVALSREPVETMMKDGSSKAFCVPRYLCWK